MKEQKTRQEREHLRNQQAIALKEMVQALLEPKDEETEAGIIRGYENLVSLIFGEKDTTSIPVEAITPLKEVFATIFKTWAEEYYFNLGILLPTEVKFIIEKFGLLDGKQKKHSEMARLPKFRFGSRQGSSGIQKAAIRKLRSPTNSLKIYRAISGKPS